MLALYKLRRQLALVRHPFAGERPDEEEGEPAFDGEMAACLWQKPPATVGPWLAARSVGRSVGRLLYRMAWRGAMPIGGLSCA